MKFRICVISASRTENVPVMQKHFPSAVWYVPSKQKEDYLRAGAKIVKGVKGPLPLKAKQTNTAIDDTFTSGKYDYAVTVDDDIKGCIARVSKQRIPVIDAILSMIRSLDQSRYYLAGPYGGTNTLWAPPGSRTYGSITGALQIHKAVHDLRFDNNIHGLADVDYSIQHHVTHGGVLLCGDFCLDFNIKGNAGGWNGLRTENRIVHAVETLCTKWENTGCKFEVDHSRPSGIKFRVPWKKLKGATIR